MCSGRRWRLLADLADAAGHNLLDRTGVYPGPVE
jgi:hypothetical protein